MINSNDPDSPQGVPLSGTELAVVEMFTSPFGDGDTWTFPNTTQGFCSDEQTLTISNSGTSDLTLESVISSNNDFHIVNPPAANTIVNPAQTYELRVEFCPDVSGPGPRTGTLSIHHDAVNQPVPITIAFQGNAIQERRGCHPSRLRIDEVGPTLERSQGKRMFRVRTPAVLVGR